MTTAPSHDDEGPPPTAEATETGLASAMGWAYAMDIGAKVLGPLITFILAAILGPEEFGLVAVALVYVMFIEMLQRQGLSSAIVQRKDLDDDHLHAAFWLIVGLSLALTSGSLALAGWWSGVNNTPELQPVIGWLSALLPINGLILVQEAILRREMRFRPLAVRNTAASLLGGGLGIAAAFGGFGVWALVVQQLATAVTKLVVLWSVADWRPRARFSGSHLRDLLSFSTGSFLTSIGVFVNSRADALFVGMFFGTTAIGLFRFADRMKTQVSAISLAGPSMITVALPALSRRQEDPAGFTRRLRRLVHVAVVSSFPLYGILAGVATPLMRLVGDQWLPAVAAVQLLALVGAIQALSTLVQPVLLARGHPHRQAVLTWLLAAFSAGSFIAVGYMLQDAPLTRQVSVLAASRAVAYLAVLLPTTLYVFARYGDLDPRSVLGLSMPSVVSGVLGWGAGQLVNGLVPWRGGRLVDVSSLTVVGIAATSTAIGVLLLLDTEARDILGPRFRAVIARLRRLRAGQRPAAHPGVPTDA